MFFSFILQNQRSRIKASIDRFTSGGVSSDSVTCSLFPQTPRLDQEPLAATIGSQSRNSSHYRWFPDRETSSPLIFAKREYHKLVPWPAQRYSWFPDRLSHYKLNFSSASIDRKLEPPQPSYRPNLIFATTAFHFVWSYNEVYAANYNRILRKYGAFSKNLSMQRFSE